MSNQFERALAEHAESGSSLGVTDLCFGSGWLAALKALRELQGTWATGGPIDDLIFQAADYDNPVILGDDE